MVGHGWVEWDVADGIVSAGLVGRFKKAEVEVGDVRRRGNKEDDHDDETSWPDVDYIDLDSIGDYYRGSLALIIFALSVVYFVLV